MIAICRLGGRVGEFADKVPPGVSLTCRLVHKQSHSRTGRYLAAGAAYRDPMSRAPWEGAWNHALYGEHGFYRDAAGPAAHFATAAQGIPGAGPLLAAAIVALAREYGIAQVVDFACGRGELATQVHLLAPQLSVVAVDVVTRPDALPVGIDWIRSDGGDSIPWALRGMPDALIIAHEWLDVVPCPVLQHDGHQWCVVEVDAVGEERLGQPASADDLQWCAQYWPDEHREGSRIEVGRPRDAAYAALRNCIASGVLVAVDYGHLRSARPASGTLMGYHRGVACRPRPDGSTDITAHVSMDTLSTSGDAELVRQRDLFDRLDLCPAAAPIALARTDPPAYLRSLAARSAYTALTADGGLGDFWWSIDPV